MKTPGRYPARLLVLLWAALAGPAPARSLAAKAHRLTRRGLSARDSGQDALGPLHGKLIGGRGALFTLYPDNKAPGRKRGPGRIRHRGDKARAVRPLRALQGAVDAGTAERLGPDLSSWRVHPFERIFPAH